MSTLNVTNISDGTNSTSTTNVVKGSAKAWVKFNGQGTVAITDSYNVSSITDDTTGEYQVNFTSDMPNGNYAVSGTASKNGGALSGTNGGFVYTKEVSLHLTSRLYMGVANLNGGSFDADAVCIVIHGD